MKARSPAGPPERGAAARRSRGSCRRAAGGHEIPIEERDPEEVTAFRGVPVAPAGAAARHPAFDVTPARLIAGWITEIGVLRPPFAEARTHAGRRNSIN